MAAPLKFESLGDSVSRLPQLIRSIPDTLRNPAANPMQAAILLGIVLVLALIILISVFLVIMRPGRLDEEPLVEEELLSDEEIAQMEAEARAERRVARLTLASIIVLVGVLVWVAAGITTSSADVCSSCHQNTSHAAALDDPHKGVACVDCHEGGGRVARVTVNVFVRVQHVVSARANTNNAKDFGSPAASDGCLSCHRHQIAGTRLDPQLKVKVSHKEFLAAGAQCVDCHVLKSGVVSAATVGMSPCLRCHDGKVAKAECLECHVSDPSQAIRPDIAANAMSSAQVPNPQCTGCHKDMSTCNACHGISMPHSTEFKAYGHARAAAVAIWSNNLQMCQKCHYRGHNDCLQEGCHIAPFPQHSIAWAVVHRSSTWSGSAQTCACHDWNEFDMNGMNFCQVCHPVKPANATP